MSKPNLGLIKYLKAFLAPSILKSSLWSSKFWKHCWFSYHQFRIWSSITFGCLIVRDHLVHTHRTCQGQAYCLINYLKPEFLASLHLKPSWGYVISEANASMSREFQFKSQHECQCVIVDVFSGFLLTLYLSKLAANLSGPMLPYVFWSRQPDKFHLYFKK